MPLVYAVPVFGALCFGLRIWEERKRKLGKRESDMKQKDIMKGRYQKIEVEENADIYNIYKIASSARNLE